MIFDLLFMMIWLRIMVVIGVVLLTAVLGVYMIRVYDREVR